MTITNWIFFSTHGDVQYLWLQLINVYSVTIGLSSGAQFCFAFVWATMIVLGAKIEWEENELETKYYMKFLVHRNILFEPTKLITLSKSHTILIIKEKDSLLLYTIFIK